MHLIGALVSVHLFHQIAMTNSKAEPPRPIRRSPDTSTGKVVTRQVKAYDRTTLVLSYTTPDANALRALVDSMHLKAGKKPSLSVLARRALEVYRRLLARPGVLASEIEALNRLTTPVPKPAPKDRLKRSQ